MEGAKSFHIVNVLTLICSNTMTRKVFFLPLGSCLHSVAWQGMQEVNWMMGRFIGFVVESTTLAHIVSSSNFREHEIITFRPTGNIRMFRAVFLGPSSTVQRKTTRKARDM